LSFTLEFNLEQKSLNQSSSKGVKWVEPLGFLWL
jgi:hypothetical protein